MIIPVIPKCITGTLPVPERSSQNLPSANKLKGVVIKFQLATREMEDGLGECRC